LALTMPAVTVFSKPNGEPMASTHSPTRRLRLTCRAHDRQALGLDLEHGHVGALVAPSTLALNSRLSVSLHGDLGGAVDHVGVGQDGSRRR
jgi:hypothetical protein